MKKKELKIFIKAILNEAVDQEGGTVHTMIVTTDGFFGLNERNYVEELMMHNLKRKFGFDYTLEKEERDPTYKKRGPVKWTITFELPPRVNMQVVKNAIENDPHVESVEFEGIKDQTTIQTEGFKFKDFKWLSNMAGFGTPTDVFWDTIYLGTIEEAPDGAYYRITLVDTPQGKKRIGGDDTQNQFKSKNLAAETLHRTWKMIRREGLFSA